MTTEIIVAVITSLGTILGVGLQNAKHNDSITNLLEYRMRELEKKQDKHNQVIDRVYALEKAEEVIEEKIRVANNRIDDLEELNGGR